MMNFTSKYDFRWTKGGRMGGHYLILDKQGRIIGHLYEDLDGSLDEFRQDVLHSIKQEDK